ncbi:MAG: hypothetical protein J2P48_15795 [Alphaproteobacteria bacterium]|nr:hypothetical protein [Alphaproteobacteria bacterium]
MPVELFLARTHIAYFSMEMTLPPEMHTYAGGLGVLAGDTARACADFELPVVFVTLLPRMMRRYASEAFCDRRRGVTHRSHPSLDPR